MAFNSKFKANNAFSYNMYLWLVSARYDWFIFGTLIVYNVGLDARKPVFGGFANNTGTDQPAHPRRLISIFVIRKVSYLDLL